MSRIKIHCIYSSDYQRAARTAEIIRRKQPANLPFFLDEDLRERSWGELEGLRWADIERRHPDAVEGIRSGSLDFAPTSGESKKVVLNRIMRFMGRMVRKHPEEVVLVVTHGGVAGIILKHALGIDIGARTPFRVENCALHVIDSSDGAFWYVHTLNDMAHLGLQDMPGCACACIDALAEDPTVAT